LTDILNALVDSEFLNDLKESVNVLDVYYVREILDVHKMGTSPAIDAATLSKNIDIDLQTANKMVNVMTQRGIMPILHPTLSRRFRTNDRQLRYRQLPVDMFTDTMSSKTKSYRGNKCAQVFATANGWTRAFPMERKSDAHDALSLLHQRVGVPNTMIMDGAKEQVLGKFRRECRQAGSYVKQLELENEEMKRELMEERQKVRKLSIQDGIDEPWKEAAMAMARILAEQKGVSMREVLDYFNAPVDE